MRALPHLAEDIHLWGTGDLLLNLFGRRFGAQSKEMTLRLITKAMELSRSGKECGGCFASALHTFLLAGVVTPSMIPLLCEDEDLRQTLLAEHLPSYFRHEGVQASADDPRVAGLLSALGRP